MQKVRFCIFIFWCVLSLVGSQSGTVCKEYTNIPGTCSGQTIYINNFFPSKPTGSYVKKSEVYETIQQAIQNRIRPLQESLKNIQIELLGLYQSTLKDCNDIKELGSFSNGIYNITVRGKKVEVYCDMETDGGGWTVIQRRVNNMTDFYLGWEKYKTGFGDKTINFWLGLDTMSALTNSNSYQLRVDLEDFDNNTAYALYSSFRIQNESTNYKLNVGGFSGTAGDSLDYHNKMPFTTKDRDNDRFFQKNTNCAVEYHGAWWYNHCQYSNLNGLYLYGGVRNASGIDWYFWKQNRYSMKRAEMKIKPTN